MTQTNRVSILNISENKNTSDKQPHQAYVHFIYLSALLLLISDMKERQVILDSGGDPLNPPFCKGCTPAPRLWTAIQFENVHKSICT